MSQTGGETTVYVNSFFQKNTTAGVATSSYYLGGKMIATKERSTLRYVHGDSLGSSVATDASGASVGSETYLPFGESRTASGTFGTDRKFTGQRLDGGTGLYFYNARYYDPTLGRFASADTLVPQPMNPQAWNRYSYVLNNPLRYTDPTGHYLTETEHNELLGLGHAMQDGMDLSDDERERYNYLTQLQKVESEDYESDGDYRSVTVSPGDAIGSIPLGGTIVSSNNDIVTVLSISNDEVVIQVWTDSNGDSPGGDLVSQITSIKPLREAGLETQAWCNSSAAFGGCYATTTGADQIFSRDSNGVLSTTIETVIHEAAHVSQYLQVGKTDFTVTYIMSWGKYWEGPAHATSSRRYIYYVVQ